MLGDRLKKLRSIRELSQEELSKHLDLSRGTYAHYEINKRQPDYETLKKLADFFEVSTDYLISGKKDSNRDSTLPELTQKDEKDIAKRMEKMKKDLKEASVDGDGLNFMGEPMSEEAIESLLEALEHAERIATLANKKYAPNKYKNKE